MLITLQGELGDSTSVLSKEWQALTPRANSCTSGGSGATLQHACLDGLLDGIAELSTCADADGSVHSGGSVGGGGLPGFAGSPGGGGTGGSPFGVRLRPCDSPPRPCSRQASGLQVQCVACSGLQLHALAWPFTVFRAYSPGAATPAGDFPLLISLQQSVTGLASSDLPKAPVRASV